MLNDFVERTACGIYRELVVYSSENTQADIPAGAPFGIVLQECIVCRMKHIIHISGHTNIRDHVLRAKINVKQEFMDPPPNRYRLGVTKKINNIIKDFVESTTERKIRLSIQSLGHLEEQRSLDEIRDRKRKLRQSYIEGIEWRYDYAVTWSKKNW